MEDYKYFSTCSRFIHTTDYLLDIQANSAYRTLNDEEVFDVRATSPTELDAYRSKVDLFGSLYYIYVSPEYAFLQIILKITFGQNRSFWIMKIVFPLDVITIMGFGIFLVIPTLVSPTQDQQLSILTFLAGILIALVRRCVPS